MSARFFVLTFVCALPTGLAAQVDVSVRAGVHLHRPAFAERALFVGNQTDVFGAPGEAPLVGLRATYWLKPKLGLEADLAASHNKSWYGQVSGPTPILRKITSFTGVAAVYRPFGTERRLQLRAAAGPTLIGHLGNGESLLARPVDIAFAARADAHVRVGSGLSIGIDVQNYRFSTDYRATTDDGRVLHAGFVQRRSEWLISPSIRMSR